MSQNQKKCFESLSRKPMFRSWQCHPHWPPWTGEVASFVEQKIGCTWDLTWTYIRHLEKDHRQKIYYSSLSMFIPVFVGLSWFIQAGLPVMALCEWPCPQDHCPPSPRPRSPWTRCCSQPSLDFVSLEPKLWDVMSINDQKPATMHHPTVYGHSKTRNKLWDLGWFWVKLWETYAWY